MADRNGKIEPHGAPPYDHSFFKWGSTNPEMVGEANRLMQHREQEELEQKKQSAPRASSRCPKS